ncbi:MAG: VWA domain-containing protein [Acidobacteria bacterium]|nr:VWA domain-containing protein [Acidobacteriota bacterium]
MQRALLAAFALAWLMGASAGQAAACSGDDPLGVRITSPLGRTGLPGAVRIVAQVRCSPAAPPREVRFFVDDQLLRAVEKAPYVVEWFDTNPFEKSEIVVEVVDALGNAARDAVVLEPFEVNETAEVASVLVEAAVQDRDGRFVRNLLPSHFAVSEDGVPQALDFVSHEAMGATFALLVDSSGSMSRRMDFVQRTAATLAGYMTPLDRMVIAPFTKSIGATTGPTDDKATIVQAIDAIEPAGGTAILDALVQVSRSLEASDGRRAIVLITDGYDEHSSVTFDEALAAVKSVHATVYVVGIGGVAGISLKGERLLRQLAIETGGRSFFPSTDGQLGVVHDTLTDDVRHRYVLAYTPANQAVDGTWRAINVAVAHPDYKVLARPGYFAPKPAPIRPNIEFTALDASGRYLDLTIDDIEVVENGEVQEVDAFQEAVQPVSIVLALDASGSMRHKEAEVIESARRFVDALRPEDRVALVLFADRSTFAHDLTTNRDFSHQAIAGYKAIGGTALYDALSDSLLRLKSAGAGRRAVVVMTDGRDENNPGTAPGSVRTFADVLRHQKDTQATIFGIALGTKVDTAPLEELARISGGQALFPTEVEELDREFTRVLEDLRRRYVVSYTSTHILRDGGWRDVQVRIKERPDSDVRSTGGYFAPAR